MTTIIYNGNTPITLTATEKQFSTDAEQRCFTTFMNHVIDESGFGDKFTVTNTAPRATTRSARATTRSARAARATTRSARAARATTRATTRAAPSTHTCDDDCGHSIASHTRSRSSRTNTTRAATTPLIFQGDESNVLTGYTIETYGRGYLLFPPTDCEFVGHKYFHNAWWMPSQDAWFFRGEHFDYIVGLGASWHSSS
jgi:hypothetical protein